MTKLYTTVKEILFPTHDNGVVGCITMLNETPELLEKECLGLGVELFGNVKKHKQEFSSHNELDVLRFCVGSMVEVEFNEKNEITSYDISEGNFSYLLPDKCVTCGATLEKIENKETNEVEALICTNIVDCTAQSLSPICRLIIMSSGFDYFSHKINKNDLFIFIKEYPETPLSHLSDLWLFLKSDPNIAPRESVWKNSTHWNIEKNIWLFLNNTEIVNHDFWYIGFGVMGLSANPREVLEHPENYNIEIINKNIDRVKQLVKFFDNWGVKSYVTGLDKNKKH